MIAEAGIGIAMLAMGYLLGSIPTAYIVTRLTTGRDIRQLGGGNVGGLNVFREVGARAAVPVAIVDLGKGAAAAAIAYWWLDFPLLLVLLAGLGTVIGHNWVAWLRFTGGKGMGPAIGSLMMLMPVYGYWQGLLIFFGVILVPFAITRNVALSMGTGLVALPLIVWLGTQSLTATVMAIILGLIVLIKYFPAARTAWNRSESKKDFVFDRWRRNQR